MLPLPLLPSLPSLPTRHLELSARVQHRLDRKTKPQGALGAMEALALRLALIQGTEAPSLHAPQLLVCAADHGISRQGTSAYPREVTAQMVANMLQGGAAVSVLARQHGLALTIADCGVDAPPQPGATLLRVRSSGGSDDASQGPAMTEGEAKACIAQGMAWLERAPGNALLLGEMGIGNTASASLLMHALTGVPLADCVGRGTGLDDAGLAHKHAVLARAVAANPSATLPGASPWVAAAAFGGFEILTLAGATLAAAAQGRVVVVDGFITTAAVALADALSPGVRHACVAAHASAEAAHRTWLKRLDLAPLLQLDLRLGEGSGAALAWPLLPAACALLNEMASFDDAGVSDRTA